MRMMARPASTRWQPARARRQAAEPRPPSATQPMRRVRRAWRWAMVRRRPRRRPWRSATATPCRLRRARARSSAVTTRRSFRGPVRSHWVKVRRPTVAERLLLAIRTRPPEPVRWRLARTIRRAATVRWRSAIRTRHKARVRLRSARMRWRARRERRPEAWRSATARPPLRIRVTLRWVPGRLPRHRTRLPAASWPEMCIPTPAPPRPV